MMHARLLGRALTITTVVSAALAAASLPFTGTDAPSIALVILVVAGLAAYWINHREHHHEASRRQLERHRRSEEEARRTYDLSLETWAQRSDVRGGLREGDSRRVAALAVLLARDLGLDDAAVTNVRRGALLHDIGMLGVPADLLLKPGPLTPAEREIVEQHPTIARDVLIDDPLLEPALAIPYAHHERWDGAGYPLGLAGEEIPLAARLFAVVDHWEALTTDRPFRRAWPKSAALGYLRSNAGTLFEPRMVDAFLRVLGRAPRAE